MITEPGAFPEFDFGNLSEEALMVAATELGEVAGKRKLASEVGSAMINAAENRFGGISEAQREKLPAAFAVYEKVIAVINKSRDPEDQVGAATEEQVAGWFEEQLAEWRENGGLEYVRQYTEANPDAKFTLVAQPNIEIDNKELWQLARSFQPFGFSASSDGYDLFGSYTPAELSGVKDNAAAVRFLLIPSGYGIGDQPAEKASSEEAKDENQPYLQIPAPAVAPTYWYTLRQNGDLPPTVLDDHSSALDITAIGHVNLRPVKQDRDLHPQWPYTYIGREGNPELSYVHVPRTGSYDSDRLRLAVG